ncbi:MAG: hypothetical protein II089_13180 [Selenomonas sp.]|nr:hypothetical protein [Selenomonas sp.]
MVMQIQLPKQVPQEMLGMLREVQEPVLHPILLKCQQVEVQAVIIHPQEVRLVAHQEVTRQVHKVVPLLAHKVNHQPLQRQWARCLW